MRTYEALYIALSDKTEDEIQTMANGVETLITESGGSIVRSEVWGKRRLAYKVGKISEGVYILVRFQSDPEFIEKLKGHFRLAEDILRHLVTFFDEKTLALEAEQEAKNKVLAEARIASGSSYGGRSRDDDDDDRPRRPRRDDDDERPRRPRREESRPAPARAATPKPEDTKPAEAKPEQAKAEEAKPAETKPEEPAAAKTETAAAETPAPETPTPETPAAKTTETPPESTTEVEA